jgi:hypothetical protein
MDGTGWEGWRAVRDGGGGWFWDGVTVRDIAEICAFRGKTSFRSSMKSVESCSTTGSFSFCAIWVFKAETSFESVWIPTTQDRRAEISPTKRPKSVESWPTLPCNISISSSCCSAFSSSGTIRPCASASSISVSVSLKVSLQFPKNQTCQHNLWSSVKFVAVILITFPSNAEINSRKMKRETEDWTWSGEIKSVESFWNKPHLVIAWSARILNVCSGWRRVIEPIVVKWTHTVFDGTDLDIEVMEIEWNRDSSQISAGLSEKLNGKGLGMKSRKYTVRRTLVWIVVLFSSNFRSHQRLSSNDYWLTRSEALRHVEQDSGRLSFLLSENRNSDRTRHVNLSVLCLTYRSPRVCLVWLFGPWKGDRVHRWAIGWPNIFWNW